MANRNTPLIEEFRSNKGQVGGNFEGRPVLLLTTTGAKTGRRHVNPAMYLPDGDRWVVFASRGGADTASCRQWGLVRPRFGPSGQPLHRPIGGQR